MKKIRFFLAGSTTLVFIFIPWWLPRVASVSPIAYSFIGLGGGTVPVLLWCWALRRSSLFEFLRKNGKEKEGGENMEVERVYLFFKSSGRFIGPPFVIKAISYEEAASKIGAIYDYFNGWHKAIIPPEALRKKPDNPEVVEYTAGNFHLEHSSQYTTYGITVFMKEVVAKR